MQDKDKSNNAPSPYIDIKDLPFSRDDLVQNLSFVLKVKTADKKVFPYTTSNEEIFFNSTEVKRALDFDEVRSSLLTQGKNKININIHGEDIRDQFFGASATLELIGNEKIPGSLLIFEGIVEDCITSNNITIVSLISIYETLDKSVGEFFSETCRAELGDNRCQKNLKEYTYIGTVVSIVNRRAIEGNHKIPNGKFFLNGIIKFNPTSSTKSYSARIINQIGNYLYFLMPPPYEIEVGCQFEVIAGCDKSFTTCRDKFNNIANFRGEPFLNGKNLKLVTRNIEEENNNDKDK